MTRFGIYDSLRKNPLALGQKRQLKQMETRCLIRVRRNAGIGGVVNEQLGKRYSCHPTSDLPPSAYAWFCSSVFQLKGLLCLFFSRPTEELVICSEMQGKLTLQEQPAAGATVLVLIRDRG